MRFHPKPPVNGRELTTEGAYISSTAVGTYEGIVFGPATPFLDPDSYLFTTHSPDHPRNLARD